MGRKMISVEPDWWKTLFDEIYLITDARSVCNEALTRREVDFIEIHLAPNRTDRILDLCGGQGRHSLEMARRGYEQLTVFDYSEVLLKRGRECAVRERLDVRFLRGDARNTGFEGEKFDLVLIMANSFGYFPDEKDNIAILMELCRMLSPGGRLLLDLVDYDYMTGKFQPISWHEATEDIVVCRQRELEDGLIRAREMVLSKSRGMIRDAAYCERVYREGDISDILYTVGFQDISVLRNFSSHDLPGDYGCMTNRMIVTGKRP